ncbi:Uncharacterised protein [Legionella lansingensis]|uniref:Uncharacterized protein n=1 Tax=Legionella lansingensis TaxID=45067 RepID=A0A0W0VUI8_9GAMM|nr:hypothetical protein [Legionella lansingensis]KTD23904.1 hypothetical protein Llan_0685 [Legionella lansingensis]SNV46376.1 Uncharacterised protein [Legionella lansingensis]
MADIKKPNTETGVSPGEAGTTKDKGVNVVKGKPIPSGHDSLGGASSEELNRKFYRWQNGTLKQVTQRPPVKGVTYFEVLDRGGEKILALSEGADLSAGEVERVKQALLKDFKIKISNSRFSYKGVARGFSTLGVSGSLMILSGILEAIQLLEIPEQIDAIKETQIDPIIVDLALGKSKFSALLNNKRSSLQKISWEEGSELHSTNLLIDTETGNIAAVVLEATDDLEVGQIVGIGRARFVAENVLMKSNMYKDNRTNDVYFQSERGNWLVIGPSTGSWELFPFQ